MLLSSFNTYCLLWGEGCTDDLLEKYLFDFFFLCVMVSFNGGVGKFVPLVMVEEREDATGAWSFQILVSYS
jgi:hypothetical protein